MSLLVYGIAPDLQMGADGGIKCKVCTNKHLSEKGLTKENMNECKQDSCLVCDRPCWNDCVYASVSNRQMKEYIAKDSRGK